MMKSLSNAVEEFVSALVYLSIYLSIYLVMMPYAREDILGICAVEQSKYVTRKDESIKACQ